MPNRGLPEPLLWGAVEVLCFGFLFVTPFLGDSTVASGWYCLAVSRALAIAGWQYLCASSQTKERMQGVLRALLYSVPFWASSLLFPLRAYQSKSVIGSLGVFAALVLLTMGLGFLKTHWFAALIGALTVVSLAETKLGVYALPLGLSLCALLWPREKLDSSVEVGEFRSVLLLGTAGWAFSIYLILSGFTLELSELGKAILAWMLLTVIGSHLLIRARQEREARSIEREVEFSVPGLQDALSWQTRRVFQKFWTPWLLVLPAFLWSPDAVVNAAPLVVVAALAFPGLWALVSKDWVSEQTMLWWASLQFLLLWGVSQAADYTKFYWVGGALLLLLCIVLVPSNGLAFSGALHHSGLENSLWLGLRVTAPAHFASKVLSQKPEPSVDIDQGLSAAAPSGFRQRLLARLKNEEDD